MQAGTELNHLVGERVWGKDWADARFAPSQFTLDAWMVVEKLRAQGWDVTVQVGRGPAYCTVEREHPYLSYEASDDSVCMAICLAALKAVGVQVD